MSDRMVRLITLGCMLDVWSCTCYLVIVVCIQENFAKRWGVFGASGDYCVCVWVACKATPVGAKTFIQSRSGSDERLSQRARRVRFEEEALVVVVVGVVISLVVLLQVLLLLPPQMMLVFCVLEDGAGGALWDAEG